MQNLNKLRMKICDIAHKKKEGHIGSSLSILDILNCVYKLKENNNNLELVLSKGHASLGLYAILNHYGFIDDDSLESFCDFGSPLGGHPDYKKIPGFKFSTGSLGHGLPQAIGYALANRLCDGGHQVVVVCGDGEMNEGSMWESALLAAHHKIDSLKLIVDFNGSSERALSVENVPRAFEALGWEVSFIDGHNEVEIEASILLRTSRPHLIWAKTVKGKGISFMEGNPEWHHKSPNEHELLAIKKELGYA